MTLTERSNRYNPVREDGSVFSAVLLPSAASRNPGAGAVAPAGLGVYEGEGNAHPLQIFRKKIFRGNSTNENMQKSLD